VLNIFVEIVMHFLKDLERKEQHLFEIYIFFITNEKLYCRYSFNAYLLKKSINFLKLK